MEHSFHAVHTSANVLTIVCVVWRMNHMSARTPWLDMVAWWCLGVGVFWEILQPHKLDTGHVLASIGIALIAMVLTQPDWRPLLANRRELPEDPLPPDCDRRCQRLMGARSSKSDDDPHVPAR